VAVTILFPETFDMLIREVRDGIVFHKSPRRLLLIEKKVLTFLTIGIQHLVRFEKCGENLKPFF